MTTGGDDTAGLRRRLDAAESLGRMTMSVAHDLRNVIAAIGAQTALLGIIKELKTNADLTIDLEGFTDPTGPREYNYGLSQRRVDSVRRYLIENGADLGRIYSIGMGPLNGGAAEHAKLRRVTVRLMVNPTD